MEEELGGGQDHIYVVFSLPAPGLPAHRSRALPPGPWGADVQASGLMGLVGHTYLQTGATQCRIVAIHWVAMQCGLSCGRMTCWGCQIGQCLHAQGPVTVKHCCKSVWARLIILPLHPICMETAIRYPKLS